MSVHADHSLPFFPLRQVFASAIELVATAYLSWFIFGIPVDLYTFVALVLIVTATVVYSLNPIRPVHTPPAPPQQMPQ